VFTSSSSIGAVNGTMRLKIRPSVSLLRKTPSSPVSCHAQVSTLTEPCCSGPKIERSFMRTWTKESPPQP
ncbi:hypothetical protein INR49_003608, partial [Caranx melampygus]